MTPHIEKETCLKETEWREVHDFLAGTAEYRKHLDLKIDALTTALDGNYAKNERRIRNLEYFRWMIAGAFCILTAVLIPVALAVIK